MDDNTNLLYWVSVLDDDMRTLKENSVHVEKNISKPSGGEVGNRSKHVGNKCGKMDAVNDTFNVRI